MRGLVQNLYAIVFRGQALVALGLVVWLISSVPDALSRDEYIVGPLAAAVIAGVICIASLWPFLTPNWAGRPRRLTHLLPLVVTHFVLPLLYGFVAMSAVIASGLAEPLARDLAIGIAVALISTSIICWGLGSVLCFWTRQPRLVYRGVPQSLDATPSGYADKLPAAMMPTPPAQRRVS